MSKIDRIKFFFTEPFKTSENSPSAKITGQRLINLIHVPKLADFGIEYLGSEVESKETLRSILKTEIELIRCIAILTRLVFIASIQLVKDLSLTTISLGLSVPIVFIGTTGNTLVFVSDRVLNIAIELFIKATGFHWLPTQKYSFNSAQKLFP